jgi:tetratricopeptide (TPR) repeat protein
MARTILTVLLIISLYVLTGCYEPDSGKSQLLPSPAKIVSVVDASEADIVENVAASRLAYQQYLESLIAHYRKVGDNMKLRWAQDELKELNKIPQYNYIIEASVAGSDLKARDSISAANHLYGEGCDLEKVGRKPIAVDDNFMRLALDRYVQLMRQYPTSDKIDDAAFRAGGICEHFKDYTIALMYYQRTYQWNPDTVYPARFKAAYILDTHLSRREEALELYQLALKKENLGKELTAFAKNRVDELTKGGGTLEEDK